MINKLGLSQEMREAFIRLLPTDANVFFDEPMSQYTTFGIGGAADALLIARSSEEIVIAITFARENTLPIYIMGNGSNLLVRDQGIRGIVIQISEGMQAVKFKNLQATVQAGCRFPIFVRESIEKNLKGLEFAGGIPGTVGGAIVMNAGAYGGCIADCLKTVTYLDEQLQIQTRSVQVEDMGYRTTIFSQEHWIVLEATFDFLRDFDHEARKKLDKCNCERREKQPLELPSAGSVFKRPEGYFAGKLIQEAGCQGLRVGDAQVSEKHAGFIVNLGQATANDVLALIEQVQKRVLENSGVILELEIHVIGEGSQ